MLDKRNFSASTPALQLFLARDRVVHVAKVFKPNKPIQLIAFREPVYLATSVLAQAPSETIRNPDVQRAAMFVGENVNPIMVVAHRVELIRDVSLRSTCQKPCQSGSNLFSSDPAIFSWRNRR